MSDDLVALFEFEKDGDDLRIVSEKHYRLVPPDAVTQEDLDRYRQRLPDGGLQGSGENRRSFTIRGGCGTGGMAFAWLYRSCEPAAYAQADEVKTSVPDRIFRHQREVGHIGEALRDAIDPCLPQEKRST